MTDDFDSLKAALKTAPAPSAAAKSNAIAQAMKNFDALQGSPGVARPNQVNPQSAGFLKGIRQMLKSLKNPGALAAGTSLAALTIAMIVILPQSGPPIGPQVINAPSTPVDEQTQPGQAVTPTTPQAAEVPAIAPAPIADTLADGDALEPQSAKPALRSAAKLDAEAAQATGMAESAAAPMAAPAPTAGVVMTAPEAVSMLEEDAVLSPAATNGESFANVPANPIRITVEDPVSTFSIDVDTASYSIIRNALQGGFLPPAAAVRVEEMVNYFPYTYPAPDGDMPFRTSINVMETPWNPGTQIVHIGLQGKMPATAERPPLNLVFLIDTSGSMEDANKLPLLKQSLALMLDNLHPADQVAIVAYAGSAGTVLEPTAANDHNQIFAALDRLSAGGSTAGAEGLQLAYQVAQSMAGDGEVSRVLLATDGDFNVGLSDPDGLQAYVSKQRETGVYLSVLGFGRGNLDDAVMQSLAQNGNGTAAYIDTLQEARKVLVDQLTGTLFPIADDVKIQVEWNPASVAEYRLIGYETRALAREDFSNDRVDAGEIGAGHSVTAIYEVTAPGSPALRNDPLRYGVQPAATDVSELGFLRLRYKAPGGPESQLVEIPIPAGGVATDDARFAVAIAGFGQLLTTAQYLNGWSWDQAIELALAARGEDPFGYRIEAVNLMRMAKALSAQ